MKNLEKEFFRLWESEMKDKQIPVAKKHEMKRIAWEWFFKGVEHISEIIEEKLK